ncbi:MAG TPA: 50S ribosomal protein L21 [Actinomycetota bacterium]|nr:50S ribosomal protein L21 [Actinomycetota bacterium]
MYAVIKTGGKQHRVKAGDVIEVELVHGGQDETVTFTPILVVDDDGKAHVGKDLGKASVTAKLVGEQKGDKVKIFKYRQKTGYARKQGHRQLYTLMEIQDVKLGGRAAAKKAEPVKEPKPAPEAEVEAPAAPAADPAEAVPEAAPEPEATEPQPGQPDSERA